jgi:hypothetical protein
MSAPRHHTTRMHYHYPFKNYYRELYLKVPFVAPRKHNVSVLKTNQLMPHEDIMLLCFELHIKHIKALCAQNENFRTLNLAAHKVTTGL